MFTYVYIVEIYIKREGVLVHSPLKKQLNSAELRCSPFCFWTETKNEKINLEKNPC